MAEIRSLSQTPFPSGCKKLKGSRWSYRLRVGDYRILYEVCQVYLEAKDAGALLPNQLAIAVKCEVLVRGLAHTGIIALVDEATGYQKDRDRDELQRFLALYLSEERLRWAKMFPDEYYRQLFRLQGWQDSPLSVKRPKLVGVITNRLVY